MSSIIHPELQAKIRELIHQNRTDEAVNLYARATGDESFAKEWAPLEKVRQKARLSPEEITEYFDRSRDIRTRLLKTLREQTGQ